MKRLKIILRSKFFFKIIVLLCLLYSFFINFFITFKSKYEESEKKFELIVDKIEIEDNKVDMIVIGKEKMKLIYYYKNVSEINDINLGDKIEVEGILQNPLGRIY